MIALRQQRTAEIAATTRAAWLSKPEIELLLTLARAHLRPVDAGRLESILHAPISWDAFVQLAERHRLVPLCARHLNRLNKDLPPAGTMQTMRDYTESNVRRNLRLAGELRAILRLFQQEGIPALAYKGPVLAQDLYGSIALRDILDLDVLVHKRDALRARDLLFARGYRSVVPTGRHWDTSLLSCDCNFPLVQDESGFVVELHWSPETGIAEQHIEEFWRRCEYVSLAGMQVATFSRQDLVLLMCLHGCRHMWERLEWIVGLSALLSVSDVQWKDLLRLASSIGGRRALFLGVILAHDLLDAPVPADVLRQARAEHQMNLLADAACRQLFSDSPQLAHQLGFNFHSFQLSSRERWRDRVRYIRQRAASPSRADWAQWDLPWSAFRLYCAARRLRLLAECAGSVVRGKPGWAGISEREKGVN